MSNMDFVEIDGKIIYYNINSEFLNCKYDKYGQLAKAQRMILFFDDSKNAIGSVAYYDDIDKVTNISRVDVIKVYKDNMGNRE